MNEKPDEGKQNEEERDQLTGLLKKDMAEIQIASKMRGKRGGTLFLCDVDDLERINRQYGHQAGEILDPQPDFDHVLFAAVHCGGPSVLCLPAADPLPEAAVFGRCEAVHHLYGLYAFGVQPHIRAGVQSHSPHLLRDCQQFRRKAVSCTRFVHLTV